MDCDLIIPVYKTVQYLTRLFNSLNELILSTEEGQINLHVIFVDDCSPDESYHLLQSFASNASLPFDCKIVRNPVNFGLSKARAVGLAASSSKYVLFADSDDYFDPMHLAVFLESIKEGADIIINSLYEENENGGGAKISNVPRNPHETTQELLHSLISNDGIDSYFPNKLFERSLLTEDVFSWSLPFEDVACMHTIFLRAKNIVRINRPTYHYLHRSESLSSSHKNNALARFLAIRKRYNDLNGLGLSYLCTNLVLDSIVDLGRRYWKLEYSDYWHEIKTFYRSNKNLTNRYFRNHLVFMMHFPNLYHLSILFLDKVKGTRY